MKTLKSEFLLIFFILFLQFVIWWSNWWRLSQIISKHNF